MADQDQAHDIEDDAAPPTWDEVREAGQMVVDSKYDKLAVYVGSKGYIVIMTQGMSEDEPHYNLVHCSDVKALQSALEKAFPEAAEQERIFDDKCEQGARDHDAWMAAGADDKDTVVFTSKVVERMGAAIEAGIPITEGRLTTQWVAGVDEPGVPL